MPLEQAITYAYRILANGHAWNVQCAYSTIDELWKAVLEDKDIKFMFPNKSGKMIDLRIRTSTIVAIDNPHGTSPIACKEVKEILDGITKPNVGRDVKDGRQP